MKLILIRHGETLGNVAEIIQGGQTQGELTKEGEEQAKKAGHRLKNEKIDVIIISPLYRTRQTSEPIIKEHPQAEIVYDENVKEMKFGVLEGKTYQEFIEIREKSGIAHEDFKQDGGESFIELFERAKNTIEKIIKKYKGKTVLIVSHGTFVRMLVDYLIDKKFNNDKKHSHGNTGITMIEISDSGKHKAHFINCTKHLE